MLVITKLLGNKAIPSPNKMDSIPENVRKQLIEGAYRGYERRIRVNLSPREEKVLERIKILMSVLKTECTAVFSPGSYACFLEGVLREYDTITIVYTCNNFCWNKVLSPETFVTLFMRGRGEITAIKRQEKTLKSSNKLDRFKCRLAFNDDITVTVDVGKLSVTRVDLRVNMMQVMTNNIYNIWKAAIPHECNRVFRFQHFRNEDINEYFRGIFLCYGSPFTLSCYAAKKINYI